MDPVDLAVWVALGLLVALSLWGIATYNRLIRLRNRVDWVWADIDVQLKKRHDLVPNLVEVVEAYATHERGTLDEVRAARSGVEAARSAAERTSAENALSDALVSLFATVEDYPELEAEESAPAQAFASSSSQARTPEHLPGSSSPTLGRHASPSPCR